MNCRALPPAVCFGRQEWRAQLAEVSELGLSNPADNTLQAPVKLRGLHVNGLATGS